MRPTTVAPSRIAAGGSIILTRTRKVRVRGSACGSTSRTRPIAVTLGSSIRATVIFESGGAEGSIWAGMSNTASHPISRATRKIICPGCTTSPVSAPLAMMMPAASAFRSVWRTWSSAICNPVDYGDHPVPKRGFVGAGAIGIFSGGDKPLPGGRRRVVGWGAPSRNRERNGGLRGRQRSLAIKRPQLAPTLLAPSDVRSYHFMLFHWRCWRCSCSPIGSFSKQSIRALLDPAVPRLFNVDVSKALYKAICGAFGRDAAIQRCQIHKARNILNRLPKSMHAQMRRAFPPQSWMGSTRWSSHEARPVAGTAAFALLHEHHRERHGHGAAVCWNVKHWRLPSMALRGTGAAMQEAAKGFIPNLFD